MAEIKMLDQNTINQIAAGEVIDRPASVVKELTENAMDAKATMITVEIKEGGIDFIRITDNGFGIEKEQVETAFLPHATSKIRSMEDLLDVTSLGFRGEALASIASVAKVEVITKTDESMTGVRYQIEGGKEIEKEEIGCPCGTTFLVRHLFYNTPARRKFLKSKTSEAGYIEQLLYHLALSHPGVAFKFIVNNKNKLNTNGNGNLKDVIYQIYGREAASNLIAIEAENSFMKIKGFIGKPVLSRGNRQAETYFINERYIKNKTINKAIEEAYKSFTMVHKYPFTVLHIEIQPDLLDVNVHPAKMEVRLKREEEIFSFLYTTLREALNRREMIPNISLGSKKEKNAAGRSDANIEQFETKRGGYASSPYVKPKVLRENDDFFEQSRAATRGQKSGKDSLFERPQSMTREQEREKIKRELETLEDILRPKQEEKTVEQTSSISQGGEDGNRQVAEHERNKTNQGAKENLLVENRQKEQCSIDSNQNRQEDRSPATDEKKVEAAVEEEERAERESEISVAQLSQEGKEAVCADQDAKEIYEQGTEKDSFGQLTGEQLRLFSKEEEEKQKEKYHIIGSLFDTYWLLEGENKLFMLDQHAAHEKVMFEKLMAQKEKNEIYEQQLNPPIIVSLTLNEQEMIQKYEEQFKKLGFTIEQFGSDEYCIRTVPANLYGLGEREVLMEMIDQLCEDGILLEPDKIFYKIATMSCKAAVKGNQKLTIAEAKALIDQLMTLENPYTCPHGRPIFISMTKTEIEKMFKRIQS